MIKYFLHARHAPKTIYNIISVRNIPSLALRCIAHSDKVLHLLLSSLALPRQYHYPCLHHRHHNTAASRTNTTLTTAAVLSINTGSHSRPIHDRFHTHNTAYTVNTTTTMQISAKEKGVGVKQGERGDSRGTVKKVKVLTKNPISRRALSEKNL